MKYSFRSQAWWTRKRHRDKREIKKLLQFLSWLLLLLASATLSGNGNDDPGDNDEVIEGHDDDIDVVNDDCDDVEWAQSCFSSFPLFYHLWHFQHCRVMVDLMIMLTMITDDDEDESDEWWWWNCSNSSRQAANIFTRIYLWYPWHLATQLLSLLCWLWRLQCWRSCWRPKISS